MNHEKASLSLLVTDINDVYRIVLQNKVFAFRSKSMGIESLKEFKRIELFFDLRARDLLKQPQEIKNLVEDCYNTKYLGDNPLMSQLSLDDVLTEIEKNNLI